MNLRSIAVFIISCISIVAYAQPFWLLHQPYAAKYYYSDSVYNNYDKINAIAYIQKIDDKIKWAAEKHDLELIGELQRVKYRIKLEGKDKPTPSLEKELIDLDRQALANNQPLSHINYLQLLGFYYWNKSKNHSLAFENYLTAYKLYSGVAAESFPIKREYLYTLGTAYYVYDDYENAIKYLKEALATKPATTSDFLFPIYTSLGLCYRNKGNYDSSDWYFRELYKLNDKEWKAVTAGNIGINYFHQKRYDEAIPLLEQEIEASLRTNNNIRSAANSLYILSLIYFNKHDFSRSQKLLTQAHDISGRHQYWFDFQLQEHIFTQLHHLYTATGDIRLANLYADSALAAKDSFQVQYNSLNLAKAQEKTEYIQHKLETEKLLNQKHINELIRNALLGCAILLSIIFLLYVNRQRLKHKKLEAEKQIAETDLRQAALKLDSFRQSVQEKNQLIEHFTAEIEKIRQTEIEQSDNELRSQLERATILTDEQWEDFRDLFEQVHKGFFGGLKKKIPDLTQAEIRFLALTKMKLTSKEMASMLGISVNAIRMNRHRLRKKLDLDKDDMIEELVENI